MEKDRSSKVIAIAALLIAVLGLSLGFAAYASNLTIKSSAGVTANPDDFSVKFSSSDEELETNNITPEVVGATGEEATINNDNAGGPVIENLKANFTAPGQTVTYKFYARNTGKYKAYLKGISYAEVSSSNTKVCTKKSTTTQSLVDEACKHISISTTVGSESAATGSQTYSSHELAAGGSELVTVVIKYEQTDAIADGDFDVEFGDIKLQYSSVDE